MGLNVTLVTFSPGTLIKSSDANSNFSNINNASSVTGTSQYATQAVNLAQPGAPTGASVDSTGKITFATSNPNDPQGNHYAGAAGCSGNGSGTFTHNFVGTPTMIAPMVSFTGQSEGLGVDTIGSSTFHINMSAADAWRAQSFGI